jgi:hypothetical protein
MGKEDVQKRWGHAGVNSIANHTAPRTLPIRYIQPGAVIVPGITGKCIAAKHRNNSNPAWDSFLLFPNL